MKTEHIKVIVVREGVDIFVDDYEVFDLLEDRLAESDMEYEYTKEENLDGVAGFLLHFGAHAPIDRLHEIIESIPSKEIERIWNLNNRRSTKE